MGARSCETKDITVSPPVAFAAAELSAALDKIDVAQLTASKDPGAVATAALQMASLLSFAATSGVQTSDAAAGAPAPQSDLINLLASTGNSGDPDQMNSLLSAGAQLSAVGGLSAGAGMSLISLFG